MNRKQAVTSASASHGLVDNILAFGEPALEYKLRVNVLGESPDTPSIRKLRQAVKSSRLVTELLRYQDSEGRIAKPKGVYAKWQGAHWIMATLADIGYPTRDKSIAPIRDQLLEHWLAPAFYREFDAPSRARAYSGEGVPVMEGRHRRCASQQSNALWSILRLDLTNKRTHEFVERLLYWQWPDGGWNCDKNPAAHHSSYMETILPLRALALYADRFDHVPARNAANRASEIFLKRHLYRRLEDDTVIKAEFTELHYPLYWHYDILHGLRILAESGYLPDPRCNDALDLLVSMRTPDGGWPATRRYYKTSSTIALGNDFIDWGGTSKRKMNPWVTVDALYVLKVAGRLDGIEL